MPHKLCSTAGCPNPPTARGRCDFHRKAIERERSARRREATKGVYKTRMWARRRLQVLSRDPICADGRVCGHNRLSTEVDHIVPLDQGGERYAMSNLRGTCSDCHQAKTAEENRRRRGISA
jgi:5-methylcytosine-specific restriction endonuclease McrA